MSNKHFKGKARRAGVLGAVLSRATQTIPQTTQYALFNIIGGKVLMTSIVGEVTTAIGSAGTLKLILTADATTAGDTDLCAAVDMSACTEGDLLSITGLPATNMLVSQKGSVQTMDYKGVAMNEGTLDLHAADSSTTGDVKWVVTYVPIDDEAEMTVA